MRIIVFGMSASNIGGIEVFLTQMQRFMTGGTFFDYVVEGETCRFQNTIYEAGGKIYFIRGRQKRPIGNLQDIIGLLKRLKSTHEAVYFNLNTLSWIEPIRIATAFGYRVYVHSHIADTIADDGFHHLLYRINRKRLSYYTVCRLACCNQAKDYMFMPNETVELINNAIDTRRFRFNYSVRSKVRSELSIADDEKTIGFVGRLTTQKNPLFLPVILKSVHRAYGKNVKLIILGEGEQRLMLKNKLAEYGLSGQSLLLGNKENIEDYYQSMDVLVMPSLLEGFPITAVEAQACGLHCLVSDRVTNEINLTGNVDFIPLDDAKKWGDQIALVLKKKLNREIWSDYVCESGYNIRKEARKLEEILLI